MRTHYHENSMGETHLHDSYASTWCLPWHKGIMVITIRGEIWVGTQSQTLSVKKRIWESNKKDENKSFY